MQLNAKDLAALDLYDRWVAAAAAEDRSGSVRAVWDLHMNATCNNKNKVGFHSKVPTVQQCEVSVRKPQYF